MLYATLACALGSKEAALLRHEGAVLPEADMALDFRLRDTARRHHLQLHHPCHLETNLLLEVMAAGLLGARS